MIYKKKTFTSSNIKERKYFSLKRSMTTIHMTTNNHKISEQMQIVEIEHLLPENDNSSRIFLVAVMLTFVLIITTNGYLLYLMMKQKTKTFLDWMIILDIIFCFGNNFGLYRLGISGTDKIEMVEFCSFLPFFLYFINMCNKLLSIGIVVYRYINIWFHMSVSKCYKWLKSSHQS